MNLDLIGNLGNDAVVRNDGGASFVLFSVANTERFSRRDGTQVETTDWVNCILNGDGGNLLQYLKKGRKVFVRGRAALRVFSSEKDRRMKAGVDLNVREIELIGQSETFPKQLCTHDGELVQVNTAYWVEQAHIPQDGLLYDRALNKYRVDQNGFILRVEESQVDDGKNANGGEKDVEEEKMNETKAKSNAK